MRKCEETSGDCERRGEHLGDSGVEEEVKIKEGRGSGGREEQDSAVQEWGRWKKKSKLTGTWLKFESADVGNVARLPAKLKLSANSY